MILTKKEFNDIRYFFSLVLEDYEDVGDKKELFEMADVTEEYINKFLEEKNIMIV